MIPWSEDLIYTTKIDKKSTFGDKGELRALTMGEMRFLGTGPQNGTPVTTDIEDVPWIPWLPCRLISSEIIHCEADIYFFDSGVRRSVIVFNKWSEDVFGRTPGIREREGTDRYHTRIARRLH